MAHGVYHVSGAPYPDHLELRAAWLQLSPALPAWNRGPAQGVVSHRSAAALYGYGHLPADRHHFTLPGRRQSRRPDIHLHRRQLEQGEWVDLRGLLVTRPARIASDLVDDREDPGAVALMLADAIRAGQDHPGAFAMALAPHAERFALHPDDGVGLLRWLLDLVGDPATERWIAQAETAAQSA